MRRLGLRSLPRRCGCRRGRSPINAGEDGEVVVDEILKNKNPAWGYNAASGEFVDMFKSGIIDPTKVARTALLNAASVSGLALTTEVLITELKEKKGEDATPVAGRWS